MKKSQNTTSKILAYITQNTQATPKELASSLEVSPQMIHRTLVKLVEENQIAKIGVSPHVYYILKKDNGSKPSGKDLNIDDSTNKIIEENFYTMTPEGREIFGMEAFLMWCDQRKYNPSQKATEYAETFKKYNSINAENIGLDATSKILSTFKDNNKYLDKLMYLYPYSLPVFGRTKISEMLFHAKQNQDERLMKKVFNMVQDKLVNVIKHIQPDAIGFIPPTLPRKKQLMKELQTYLHLDSPMIQIEKIKTPITIQQKTLKQIEDRIANADHTMVVINTKKSTYKKVLLIDDFTGSGATLNQVAKKCKQQGIAEMVVGLTLTGSVNGFDVIREI